MIMNGMWRLFGKFHRILSSRDSRHSFSNRRDVMRKYNIFHNGGFFFRVFLWTHFDQFYFSVSFGYFQSYLRWSEQKYLSFINLLWLLFLLCSLFFFSLSCPLFWSGEACYNKMFNYILLCMVTLLKIRIFKLTCKYIM